MGLSSGLGIFIGCVLAVVLVMVEVHVQCFGYPHQDQNASNIDIFEDC